MASISYKHKEHITLKELIDPQASYNAIVEKIIRGPTSNHTLKKPKNW
jgi:hypothetical protein